MTSQTKRLFDLTVAGLATAVFSPVFALIALLIRFSDGAPVIYAQERVGRGGETFYIYKFRTMRNTPGGLKVSTADDARITTIGKYLRKTKLDELPQLWNVLQGNMSLVGPRPEVPEFVALWTDRDRQVILSVEPGITDPASLKFRNEADLLASADDPRTFYVEVVMPEKCMMYRAYVTDWTFLGDLKIALQTLQTVVFGAHERAHSRDRW